MSDPSGIVQVELPAQDVLQFLATTGLFHRCEPAVLQRVAPVLSAFHYPAGSEVLTPGVAAEAVGFVFAGRVSVRLPAADGAEPPFEVLLPGESLCEVAAFPGGIWPYAALADDDAQLLWLGAEDAQVLAARVPPFAVAAAARLGAQVARLAKAGPQEAAAPAPGEFVAGAANPFDPRGHGAHGPAIPFVELREFDVQPTVLAMLPLKLIRQHRMIPVRLADRRLTVAMVAPRNVAAQAEARRALAGVDLEVVAMSQDDFNAAVTRFKLDEGRIAHGSRSGPSVNPDTLVYESVSEADAGPPARQASADEVIRFVNRVIVAGLDREASDIHLEPAGGGAVRVRFRIQGLLSDWSEPVPPGCTGKAVAARLKVLAGLDITEKRLPQDGRIGLTAGKRDVDLRVSTMPARGGEKIALRILEGAGSTRPLDQIFLDPGILGAVRRTLERPYGGILIGGPTGSGKTSTLYSLLHERQLARPDSNVLMVEDPIEYRVAGATQVQVNPGAGLGFAQVLRAMMRQDPDVIVVGEMRDQETAQLALESAMTGHLLLSSLHASDSRSVLQRLESLGCTRAVMAQALSLILVQRLVRRLCNSCRVVDAPPPALLETLIVRGIVDRESGRELPRAVGCDACDGTGYGGRLVVMDVLQITDPVRTALAAGRPLEEIERLAFSENALMPFSAYATALLGRQLIGAGEVLATLAD